MRLKIRSSLDYTLSRTTDILLQIEAAHIPEQQVEHAQTDVSPCDHFARVAAQDGIGERIWLRVQGRLTVDYTATVQIDRIIGDFDTLPETPPHLLPGETVQYLMPSRLCPSDRFEPFVAQAFGNLAGGARIAAMRDWVKDSIAYQPGTSGPFTTATDTFVERRGVCRDFAHLLVTLARASGIPARIAAVFALGVEPQDFHAVAELFVGGEWHLVDATGMAREADMAKIGIGRDAADVAFLTSWGPIVLNAQMVTVEAA